IARFTPAYGVGEIARAPLGAGYDHWAIVSVLAWLAIFVAGSAWALRRDTGRVGTRTVSPKSGRSRTTVNIPGAQGARTAPAAGRRQSPRPTGPGRCTS